MNHNFHLSSVNFSLRPVQLSDAAKIVELRTNQKLSQFIHSISPSIDAQEKWLSNYFDRENDYYFTVINNKNNDIEGFIGLYDIVHSKAEWGRWILKEGSLAAAESALLIYTFGIEKIRLTECFSRTLSENEKVVSFHKNSGALFRCKLEKHFTLDGVAKDAEEYYVDQASWDLVKTKLTAYANKVGRLLK